MSPKVHSTIEKVNSWYKTAAVTVACVLLGWGLTKLDANNTTTIETHKDTQDIKVQLTDIKKDQESMKEKISILWANRNHGINQDDIRLREDKIDL